MYAASQFDFIEILAELFVAVRQDDRHFANIERLPFISPLENDILHLAASQRLGALLPQHPANRVRNIAFSTTVGPYDGCYTRLEPEMGLICEAFKSVCFECAEIHVSRRK